MLNKTMVVLAITLVLAGSALSSSASAGDDGYGGGLGRGGLRGNHFAGALKRDRTISDGRGSYGDRVGDMRGGLQRDRRGDVWGHWGAYYGPMVSAP
jgi:hypothetical protein